MTDEDILLESSKRENSETINYDAKKMIGHGSFGAVFLAKVVETDEVVAIKKVLQDRRFKNRELQIMKQIAKQPHPYVVQLKHHFASKGSKSDDVYLNLVLEYIPETLYSVAKYFIRRKEYMPLFSVKLYVYQMMRSLAHIHGMGICHRDIKPHNLLVDPLRHVLKLCDFGSAKAFVVGEPNVAYICSRFYRAPELIFGCTDYTTAIDVWSAGCVFAELLLGSPIFPGCSAPDQFVEIIKLLGTPNREQLKSIKPPGMEFKYPIIPAKPWSTIFRASVTPETINLVSKVLDYVPDRRPTAIEACGEAFFNDLRVTTTTMPDKTPLAPELFQFTVEELSLATPQVLEVLMQNGSVLNAPVAAPVAEPVAAAAVSVSAVNESAEAVVNVNDTSAAAAPAVPVAPSAIAPPPATAVPSMVVEEPTVA